MTTWLRMLNAVRKGLNDDTPLELYGITEKELTKKFDSGYGVAQGQPFLVYSKLFVYFPICYGKEWISFVPRTPAIAKKREWLCKHYGG